MGSSQHGKTPVRLHSATSGGHAHCTPHTLVRDSRIISSRRAWQRMGIWSTKHARSADARRRQVLAGAKRHLRQACITGQPSYVMSTRICGACHQRSRIASDAGSVSGVALEKSASLVERRRWSIFWQKQPSPSYEGYGCRLPSSPDCD
jgi:hypothetical protein